ncbi:MAG TPA: hypothetical protein VN841_05150 [Bryobacteraceae bacterium]|nr:hypothetical protein [Bryobacteraceae bacterium]
MKARIKPWQLAIALIGVCIAIIAALEWQQSTKIYDPATLLQCLPQDRSVHMYLDVDTLRSSGLLDLVAGSKASEEADYRRFVDSTGFDYRLDLDAVAAAFNGGNTYFAIRGHFEWDRLSSYALAQGGRCRNAICVMPAAEPHRFISFYLLKPDVLALAVSSDEGGIYMVAPAKWAHPPQVPAAALWISTPAYVYLDPAALPEGTHAFLSPLAAAQNTTFSLGPASPGKVAMPGIDQGYVLRMEAKCGSAQDAAGLSHRLDAATDLLRKMLTRDKQTPHPGDLASVLVGGRFEVQQERVIAAWPIDGRFVQSILAGKAD